MSRLDALRALYDAVKAGRATGEHFGDMWPADDDAAWRLNKIAWRAYNDQSVDAALAFIAAMLPEWAPSVGQNVHHGYWFATVKLAENGEIIADLGESSPNPATALLLAGLAALIVEEDAK